VKESLRCELISLPEVYELSFRVAKAILASPFRPDLIIAIARGGFAPARFLCDFLNVRDMTSISIRHYSAAASQAGQARVLYPLAADIRGRHVLIADDVNDTGDTLQAAIAHVSARQPASIRTAVLHEKQNSVFRVDFKAALVTEWHWIIYPWAAVEDVGGLIRSHYASQRDIPALRRTLLDNHGIDAAEPLLHKILELLDEHPHSAHL
jgi:hypoxanthine phosphoribosyltransferase